MNIYSSDDLKKCAMLDYTFLDAFVELLELTPLVVLVICKLLPKSKQ